MDVCNKMVGKLYGIGVGPGDSELLTVKAVRLLQEADVIAVPDIGHGRQTAQGIIELYIEEKELLNCSTPMVRDRAAADASYDRIADQVCERLAAGKTVAYATLGDPTVYSTYVRIHQRIRSGNRAGRDVVLRGGSAARDGALRRSGALDYRAYVDYARC